MPQQYNSSFGNPRQRIDKYLTTIQNKLFPELYNRFSISMITFPISKSATKVSYSGEAAGNRVVLDFSSNRVELKEYEKNYVFVTAYYKSGGEDAGIIDLSDISGSAEQIYGTLYELGFRTEEDLNNEKADAEAKKAQDAEKAKADAEKRKADLRSKIQYQEEPTDNKEPDTDEEPQDIEASISQFSSDFDGYLKSMINLAEMGSKMFIIMYVYADKNNSNSFKTINVEITYISPTMCLVETSGISPKVDKTTTWDKAKSYIIAVARKIQSDISLSAATAEGKDIDITEEEPQDNVNVGVDL